MRVAAAARRLLPASLRRPGVLGVAVTPEGRLVLVRHSYAPGWHPPGGGRKRGEEPLAAATRELCEEIGLRNWTSVVPIAWPAEPVAMFLFSGVAYRPRRSIEIAEIAEFDATDLPHDASPRLVAVVRQLGLDGTGAVRPLPLDRR